MDNTYIRKLLYHKINAHRYNAGLEPLSKDELSEITKILCDNITEYGRYQIEWVKDKPVKMILIPNDCTAEVFNGMYYVRNAKGSFVKQLFSSEYIEFDIVESREHKLNKILNKS